MGTGERIGGRILLKDTSSFSVGDKRIDSRPQRARTNHRAVRVHGGNLSGAYAIGASWKSPRFRQSLDSTTGARRRGCARVKDHAILEIGTRDVALFLNIFSETLAFIGAEKEQSVFDDRTSQGAPN